MAFSTAVDILNDAAIELGLYKTALADPYASSDANVVQLCRLLNALGRELVADFGWSHLQKEGTFPTVNGTASYSLAADFGRIIDGTVWNRTQAQPLRGPLNAQQWQAAKGAAVSVTSPAAFRVQGSTMYLHSTPTAAETIAYEYQTFWWTSSNGSALTYFEVTDKEDEVWLDRRTVVDGLRMKYLRGKGFDSSAAQQDFEASLARARGADGAAPTLSLSGGTGFRLLDGFNLPTSGWGT